MKAPPTTADYLHIDELVATGAITKATKAELEQYAVMLCHPARFAYWKNPKSQLEETIRTLLIVRMSEEANREATRISNIALYIAMAALGCTFIQMLASWWPKSP